MAEEKLDPQEAATTASTEADSPIVALTDGELSVMLKRATWITLGLGLVGCLPLVATTGWRDAAMLMTGAAISAASVLEWRRMIELINAKMDAKRTQRGAGLVAIFFVLRLTFFGAAIYVSLKCFHGSTVALLGGLSLAVLAVGWEVYRLLRV